MLVLKAESFSTKQEPSSWSASDSLFHCGKKIYRYNMPLTRHLSVPFMASRPSMRLCNHHYHPPPGSFHLAELKPVPIKCKCVCAKSCPTPCDPMDCSLPSSSVHEILQARILVWVAMPSSRGSSQPRDRTQGSRIASRFFIIWATREAQEYLPREWVAYPFSRGSSWPGNRTGVSWIAGRFFTDWAIREGLQKTVFTCLWWVQGFYFFALQTECLNF